MWFSLLVLSFYFSLPLLTVDAYAVVCVARRDCYRCVTETLDYLLSTGQQYPQAPSVPRVPGPPPVHDPGRLSGAEAEKYVIAILSWLIFGKLVLAVHAGISQVIDHSCHFFLENWTSQVKSSRKQKCWQRIGQSSGFVLLRKVCIFGVVLKRDYFIYFAKNYS